MTRRVVITGMGGVTAFGENWQDVSARLLAYENAVRKMPEWQVYDGLHTLLGAPVDDFTLPEHYTRKRIRVANVDPCQRAGVRAGRIDWRSDINQRRNGHCVRFIDRQYRSGERICHHADGKAHQ